MFGEIESLLTVLTFVPTLGALVIAVLRFTTRPENQDITDRNSRAVAFWTTIITFGISCLMLWEFDPSISGFQMIHEVTWLEQIGLGYRMGVDGISVLFVMLTTFLMPICILASGASRTVSRIT